MQSKNDTELLDYKPKHVLISDVFREKIVANKFRNGDKLLPDEIIAQKYNVNKRTVAAGLNTLVNEGLLERAPRRGTIVTQKMKEAIVNRTSNAVGMVMLSKDDVYREISHNIAKGFSKNKLFPVLINSDLIYDNDCVINFLEKLSNERSYGFLIDGELGFPFDFLKQNIDKFHNIVFINKYRHYEKIAGAKYALIDFAEAGRIAARHFIARGHRKLAFMVVHEKKYTDRGNSQQVQKMRGFAEVCRENNVEFNEKVFWKLLHGAPLNKTIADLINGPNCPEAIFASSDAFVRYQLMPLLEDAKDIELLGFYNTHHAEECEFSSISIHEEKIAENAIKLLTNKTTKKEILIKPELIVRNQ